MHTSCDPALTTHFDTQVRANPSGRKTLLGFHPSAPSHFFTDFTLNPCVFRSLSHLATTRKESAISGEITNVTPCVLPLLIDRLELISSERMKGAF